MLIPLFKKPTDVIETPPTGPDTTVVTGIQVPPATDGATTSINPKDTVKTPEKPIGPKPKKSGFAKYYANIDQGKKILCFFAPSCEHCQATAKELTEMRKSDPEFPEIQIIFMDEAPEEIPNFFKFAGATYPHKVLEIIEFWNAIGNEKNVPGVCYLWNGNIMKFYEGTEGKNQFSKSDLKLQLQKIKK
jgi:thiol-disulfide isomerase/thioredoxin